MSILVRTNLSIKEVLGKVDHSGKLSKWCVELNDYELKYRRRKGMKEQVLPDFLAELPQKNEEVNNRPEPAWTLHVDRASGAERQGAELVLEVSKAMKFTFPITNNVSEYEALLSRLKLA